MVGWRNLERRVHERGGGAANQQGDVQSRTLHLLGHMDHFVERGGDQAAYSHDINLLLDGAAHDGFSRYHYAQVDNLIAVAGHHYRDDVLADVVYVALHGSYEYLACRG